jgi:polyisoprenoid-binding protein YceI
LLPKVEGEEMCDHRKESYARVHRIALAVAFAVLLGVAFEPTRVSSELITTAKDPQGTLRFRLDPSQSKFVARAFAGGLLWFKGHDHFVAAREFSGQVELTPNSITPASLELIVKADSLVETRDVFTEPQKQIINKELREIVLEPAKYPEIVFRSTEVNGKFEGGHYDVKIGGNLTLHGVTRHIVIPAQVTLTGNDLRSVGKFTIDRGNFGVKATSAVHGLVRVRDKIEFTFDIVAHPM